MASETLKNKLKTVDKDTGEEKINMSLPSILIDNNAKLIGTHVVKEWEQMRPDLISIKFYGIPDYWDIILKANSKSNPYSIKEGDELIIPDISAAKRYIKKPRKVSDKARTQFTDTRRMTQQDKKRVEFLQSKFAGKANASKENLPPNMLKTGEKTKITQGNKIILGANLKTNNRNRT